MHRFITALLVALGMTSAVRAEKPADAAEKAIRQVLADQQAAWNKADLEGFMAGYWKSPDLSFYSGNEKTRALKDAARWLGLPDGRTPIAVSAATGDGVPALWRVIDEVCENETLRAAQGDRLRGRAVIQGGRTIP